MNIVFKIMCVCVFFLNNFIHTVEFLYRQAIVTQKPRNFLSSLSTLDETLIEVCRCIRKSKFSNVKIFMKNVDNIFTKEERKFIRGISSLMFGLQDEQGH